MLSIVYKKNNLPLSSLVFIASLFFLVITFFVHTDILLANSHATYTPISPISSKTIDLEVPEDYIKILFTTFVSIISILAVIKLMLCGFQYMTSEAISTKGDAKKCIWTVIGGLFLILLSWLILQTINKDLTSYQFFDTIREIRGGNTDEE